MIDESKLIRNKNKFSKNFGKINKSQVIEVICDDCGKSFKRVYSVQKKSFIRYKRDLCRSCNLKEQYRIGERISSLTDYNKSEENHKTFEERFGKEKADKIKKKLSEHSSGKNNPMYGKKEHTKGIVAFGKSCKGKTWEEIHGKELSDKLKKQMSEKNSGKNNPMYGKPSPQGSGNGWCGWYNNLFFRSILELSFLIKNPNVKSAEYIKIPYKDYNGNERNYLPDFIDEVNLYEIKPSYLVDSKENQLKFEAARVYCENNNLNFKIITDLDINRLSDSDIKLLRESNKIKFIDRYEEKFKEKYL